MPGIPLKKGGTVNSKGKLPGTEGRREFRAAASASQEAEARRIPTSFRQRMRWGAIQKCSGVAAAGNSPDSILGSEKLFLFLKQSLRELFGVEGLQVVRLLAEADELNG